VLRPSAVQVPAQQHRGQAAESVECPEHRLLTQGGRVVHRKLADDNADRGILRINSPGVRVLAAFEARGTQDHG
jgi:hypothetical protein